MKPRTVDHLFGKSYYLYYFMRSNLLIAFSSVCSKVFDDLPGMRLSWKIGSFISTERMVHLCGLTDDLSLITL